MTDRDKFKIECGKLKRSINECLKMLKAGKEYYPNEIKEYETQLNILTQENYTGTENARANLRIAEEKLIEIKEFILKNGPPAQGGRRRRRERRQNSKKKSRRRRSIKSKKRKQTSSTSRLFRGG